MIHPLLTGIAPSQLEADGVYLENIVCYRNKGYVKRDPAGRVCVENCRGVPPSYYFIFTLRPETLHAANLILKDVDRPEEGGGGGSGGEGGGGGSGVGGGGGGEGDGAGEGDGCGGEGAGVLGSSCGVVESGCSGTAARRP